MFRRVGMLAIVVLGITSASLYAEPWSVKLGYPPDRRVVIMEARELGIAWEINDAARKLFEGGHITTASTVVTGPWFKDIASWSRNHPQYDVGICVALTNPYKPLSWRLLTSERGPTTLVDSDGFPWRNVVQFAVSAAAEDVRRELDAQIAMARAHGMNPSHLCGYYGTPFSRPDLAAVFLAAAQKYWIPATVVELSPELIERFRGEGYPVDETMIRLVDQYPLPKVDDLQPFPAGTTYEQTRDNFCRLLALLRPGITNVVARPAVGSAGLKRLTPDWQQREWATQTLMDEKVVEAMAANQVMFTTWRDIMHRFENGTPLELQELEKGLSAPEPQGGKQE